MGDIVLCGLNRYLCPDCREKFDVTLDIVLPTDPKHATAASPEYIWTVLNSAGEPVEFISFDTIINWFCPVCNCEMFADEFDLRSGNSL